MARRRGAPRGTGARSEDQLGTLVGDLDRLDHHAVRLRVWGERGVSLMRAVTVIVSPMNTGRRKRTRS